MSHPRCCAAVMRPARKTKLRILALREGVSGEFKIRRTAVAAEQQPPSQAQATNAVRSFLSALASS